MQKLPIEMEAFTDRAIDPYKDGMSYVTETCDVLFSVSNRKSEERIHDEYLT